MHSNNDEPIEPSAIGHDSAEGWLEQSLRADAERLAQHSPTKPPAGFLQTVQGRPQHARRRAFAAFAAAALVLLIALTGGWALSPSDLPRERPEKTVATQPVARGDSRPTQVAPALQLPLLRDVSAPELEALMDLDETHADPISI